MKKSNLNHIESIYCLNKPKEWYITFKSIEQSNAFAGELITIDKKQFKAQHYQNIEKDITRHWLPYFVPEQMIIKHLKPTIKVNYVEKEKDSHGFYTGVRKLRVDVDDVKTIPHIHTIGKYPTLITMPGRQLLCLRCCFIGHVKQQCITPYCRHYERYGHSTEDCVPTYSNTVANKSAPQRHKS